MIYCCIFCSMDAFSTKMTHSQPLFKKLNILPLEMLYEYHVSIFAYKLLYHNVPEALKPLFITNDRPHSYNTRSSTRMLPLFFRRLKIANFGLKYNIGRIWNSLQNYLDFNSNFSSFKTSLKHFYIGQL